MTQSPSNAFPVSDLSRAQRSPRRATHERAPTYAVIDAAPICHVSFVIDGQPFLIPTIHARSGDTLYFHGSPQSRLLQAIASGQPICVAFTLLDGIVAARSAMHHSMNYRSVVAFGSGRLVADQTEKWQAYQLTVEKLLPGRWYSGRQPNPSEDAVTAIAALDIAEASLKQRSGPPSDIESDYSGPHWAGVIPLLTTYSPPIPDPRLPASTPLPPHIAQLANPASLPR